MMIFCLGPFIKSVSYIQDLFAKEKRVKNGLKRSIRAGGWGSLTPNGKSLEKNFHIFFTTSLHNSYAFIGRTVSST